MSRFLRYLRIAFSVTCGVACVLLVIFWLRSYWWWDSIHVGWGTPVQQRLLLSSHSADLILNYDDFRGGKATFFKSNMASLPAPEAQHSPIGGMDGAVAGFLPLHHTDGYMIAVPYWFLVPLTVAAGAIPWFQLFWRFSLRTLLIAMTVVAIALSTIVVFSR